MNKETASPLKGMLLGVDLFFLSRIKGTAEMLGLVLDTSASQGEIINKFENDRYAFLIIDLEAYQGSLDFLQDVKQKYPALKMAAFGSHVSTDKLQAAKSIGVDDVMPRGKFTLQLPGLLESFKN